MSDKIITFLINLQFTLNNSTIKDIFGPEKASHLTNKWIDCNDNLLLFLNKLDTSNRKTFYNYILENAN